MDSSDHSGASNPQKAETRLVTAGRDTKAQKGFVNPPVVRGSTVLYPTAADLHAHSGEFRYGRYGTPTTKALQEALMALEGPQCAGVGARAFRACGDHLHPARGREVPAITSWSATTPTVPRAIFATACWPATASRPPISIP